MVEGLRSQDPLVNINAALEDIWQKYSGDRDEKAIRENGLRLLNDLGVSKESQTLVTACYVLYDVVVWQQIPKDPLGLQDVIPTVTNAVTEVKKVARQSGRVLRDELVTVQRYLEYIHKEDQGRDKKTLSMDFHDNTFDDLRMHVNNALRYL